MSVVELLNMIIILFRRRDGVKTRPKFFATEERSLIFPRITFLTNRNMVITTADNSRINTKVSRRII
jgi:hypothetical protein